LRCSAGTISKRYNAFGELKRFVEANGFVTTFSRDELGRSKTIDTPATDLCPSQQNNAWAQHTQFTYDTVTNGIGYGLNGKISTIEDVSDSNHPRLLWQQLARNAADRSTEEPFGATEHVSRTYDAGGRLKTVSGASLVDGSYFQQLALETAFHGIASIPLLHN
jgi:YD repeat-containing protein